MLTTRALNLFDRLHLGHRLLLDKLSSHRNPVAVVTDGELVGELELNQIIQPAYHRAQRLREYLEDVEMTEIHIEIIDKYSKLLDISESMHILMYIGPCCDEISNQIIPKRKSLGYNDNIEYLKPVMAQDGDKLTSARLRKGELDREGRVLVGTSEPPRQLEVNNRSTLQTPKGEVFHTKDGSPEIRVAERIHKENPRMIIGVGDVTCATLESQKIIPDVRIIDGITKRGKYEYAFRSKCEYHVYNPPAVLYPEVWSTISTAITKEEKTLIIVDGEEDLMGFPAVLLAPEGSVLLYGQPDVGIIWVPINQENKKLARELLENMPVIR